MKRFKKILVYLPHTIVDEYVIEWTAAIVESAHTAEVDVVSSFEGYQHLLSEPEWETFSKDVSDEWKNDSPLKDMEAKVSHTVHRRPGLKMILEKMTSGDYDLVIIPKEHCDGISFVERVVRKSTSGVLIVPLGSRPDLSSIMLGADFADITPMALDWSEAFATIAQGESKLTAVHVIKMPDMTREISITKPESLRHQLETISNKNLSELVAKYAKKPKAWETVIGEHPIAATKLLETAKSIGASLVVIGSHGRNAISSTLLGGQSIDVIRKSSLPLLVVKKKNETLSMIRELLHF